MLVRVKFLHTCGSLTEHWLTNAPQDWFAPDFTCPSSERIGRLGDGGKWICQVLFHYILISALAHYWRTISSLLARCRLTVLARY